MFFEQYSVLLRSKSIHNKKQLDSNKTKIANTPGVSVAHPELLKIKLVAPF